MPIRFIISSRRLMYQQTILKRHDGELTKRVYMAQSDSPIEGDFVKLVKADWDMIGEVMNEENIKISNKETFKRHIKDKIEKAALSYLKERQKMHSKVKDIKYEKLEVQKYMVSPLFTDEEVNLLYAIRSRALNCKTNFKNKYSNDDLLCILCKEEDDTQQHLLSCKVLQSQLESDEKVTYNVTYDDIFKDSYKQKAIITVFSKLIKIRETMINKLNPSTPQGVLKIDNNLHDSSVNFSSGK